LAAASIEVQVAMEFDNIETIKRAVEINAGVSLLPEPTIVRELAAGTLVAIKIDGEQLVRPLGIIQRRGVELGKTARRFFQLLRKETGTSDDGVSTNGHGQRLAADAFDAAEPARSA
jgi:DNA-binding transcriptional LysR family regulator